ncbi:MAG: HAMP domain-containing histidine kinase [Paludibacteraceae bacterium]|jgi:nitrogen fixation/metabolism regulation signal transduction histidine kinase|nr:HAMP domain-containing histidine kinase [Paludibacteraceae bacterium]
MRNYFKVAIVQRKKPTLFSRIQAALLSFTGGTMLVVFVVITFFIVINYEKNLFLPDGGMCFSRNLMFFIFMLLLIFLIVMFLSSLLSYIISKRLSAPLSIIEQHMSEIEVGGENAKINYPQIEGDALSRLVMQYNEMIDNLAVSVEELAKAEREETWRQMARQMAHEILNPLTPMKLLTQRMMMLTPDDPEYHTIVQSSSKVLLQSIDTITATTRALSNFARTPLASPEIVNIVDSVQYTIFLFRNNTENVVINFDTSLDEIKVLVDKEMIGHVFSNLLKNAIQSVPKERMGRIDVVIRCDDHYVYVSIIDNGDGILDENKDKIFDVNFSTKIYGMGLGLVVVKNVIEQAGGTVTFSSTYGKGSEFVVSLPLASVTHKS